MIPTSSLEDETKFSMDRAELSLSSAWALFPASLLR